MNLQQFEIALQRQAIFEIAISLLVLIALFWATYWVIKAGVRDGLREARPWHQGKAMPPTPAGYKWALVPDEKLPDMRADR